MQDLLFLALLLACPALSAGLIWLCSSLMPRESQSSQERTP